MEELKLTNVSEILGSLQDESLCLSVFLVLLPALLLQYLLIVDILSRRVDIYGYA